MTCIVGYVDGKSVWMGGDAAGCSGWDLTVQKSPKVFRVGEFLIGYSSSFRMGQLLQYSFEPPEIEGDLERYMVTKFIDAVRDTFRTGGFLEKENDAEKGGVFLVGVRGRLFRVEEDYNAMESELPYDACGCGADFAMGAMHAMSHWEPEQKLRIALRAAEAHSAGVRGPFTILKL